MAPTTSGKPAAKTPEKTPDIKADQVSAREAHEAAVSSPQKRLVAIARLRRDTMILASDEDAEVINNLASEAVRQGRASEVFVFEALGYFSETEIDFVEPPVVQATLRADQSTARVPLLNPETGEQSLDNAAADPGEAPKEPIPTHTVKGDGDANRGAGTGTDVKDEKND